MQSFSKERSKVQLGEFNLEESCFRTPDSEEPQEILLIKCSII